MMKDKILITNIQRFSLHDGPGIRTTVFLKGCSLRCTWCSNPENLTPHPQEYIKDGIQRTYGEYYSSDDLIREVLKDKLFYEGELATDFWNIISADQIKFLPGGVTFSGGECLLQMPQLEPALKVFHKQYVHTAVETCLFAPVSNLCIALKYIDFFYVDIKILDSEKCKKIEKGNLNIFLKNLDKLFSWEQDGKRKPVVVRIPVIGGYTDHPSNREAVRSLLKQYREKIIKIELIKEHNLGRLKYETLGMKAKFTGVSDELMETYYNELLELGLLVEICKI